MDYLLIPYYVITWVSISLLHIVQMTWLFAIQTCSSLYAIMLPTISCLHNKNNPMNTFSAHMKILFRNNLERDII